MEIKSNLIEKIKGSKITDEINKMITIQLKREDLLKEGFFRMCIVVKFRISNLSLNALKIERKPNRKMLYTKNY